MSPFNPPIPQPTRRMRPNPLWHGQFKMILVILAILLFGKIASFLYTVQRDCAERGGLLCWNTPPLIRDIGIRDVDISEIDVGVISGRDIPPNCEGPLEGVAAGQELPGCGGEGDGVCVVRSCPGVGAVADAVADAGGQGTSPPTEELAGTPTVDKASSWLWQTQRVQDGGAACTGPCNSEADGKSEVKRQYRPDMLRPPGFVMPTMGPPRSPLGSSSTTGTPMGTPTGEIPLQTNIESGEPRGVMRGVAWNSCASSAALLGLVAIGVVVLL